jgi:hypothetical protein
MYTDSGLLLRGPDYYYGMTHRLSRQSVFAALEVWSDFITRSRPVIQNLRTVRPTLPRYKLLLGICDNVRNLLLQLQYASFMAETHAGRTGYSITQQILRYGLLPHTEINYRMLFSTDVEWHGVVSQYSKLLMKVLQLCSQVEKGLHPLLTRKTPPLLRKWRECDFFLQNLVAVQIGLHEFRERTDMMTRKPVVALGLMYGGIELPALAWAVARNRGFSINVGYAHISHYGDKRFGAKVRAGSDEYVRSELLHDRPLVVFGKRPTATLSDRTVILLDDNCTTCVTLQLARDFLVLRGCDVIGAIVTRFPGVNRQVQMAMPRHGFPDPEILFTVIRGLVSPSPYARLIFPRQGSKRYLDQTGIFDKSRDRIGRYLLKNGTPAIED